MIEFKNRETEKEIARMLSTTLEEKAEKLAKDLIRKERAAYYKKLACGI
jgi:hypothetical protein